MLETVYVDENFETLMTDYFHPKSHQLFHENHCSFGVGLRLLEWNLDKKTSEVSLNDYRPRSQSMNYCFHA